MNDHEKLREQLWDLVYGLTSADETAALHARIKSDRGTARMYAEVRLEADLIAEAAKVEDVSVSLPQVGPQKDRAAAGRAKETSKTPAATSAGSSWSLHWLGAIGASALAALMAVGIFWREKQPQREDPLLVVDVYMGNQAVEGLPADLDIRAKDVAEGKPAAVPLKVQIAKADGTPVFVQQIQTDDTGHSRFHVPADYVDRGNKFQMFLEQASLPEQQVAQQSDGVAAPQSGVPENQVRELDRLAEATREKTAEPLVEAMLDVINDPVKARVSFSQDWYEPGQMVEFRAHITSAFTQRPPDVQSLDLRLVGPDGSALAPEEAQPHPENGVVIGKFRLPAEAQSGHYALTIQDSTRGEPQTNAIVQVGRESGRVDLFSGYARELSELAAADVKQQDGSKLNRGVAMSRTPAAGIPPREEEGRGPKADQAGAAAKETTGESGSRPGGGPADPARVASAPQPPAPAVANNSPAPPGKDDAEGAPPAPALAGTQFADSRTESKSQAMDELRQVEDFKTLSESAPTTLSLVPPPQLAGKPLLVEARQQKVVISKLEVPAEVVDGRERLNEEAELERLGRRLSIALPPQVTGVVEVYYFNNSTSPPKALWAESYDIPPRKEFDVALADGEATYAPGQTVRFRVKVRDQGQVASNVSFGYRVAPLLAMMTEDDAVSTRGGDKEFFEKRKLEAADAPALESKEGEEGAKSRRRNTQLGEALTKGAAVAPAESVPLPAPGASAAGAAGALGPAALGGGAPSTSQNGAGVELYDSSEAAPSFQHRFGLGGDPLNLAQTEQLAAEQPATPTLLASNADAVRRVLDEQQAAEAAREARIALWRHWLGKGLLLGGVVLLVVLGVGVYVQRPSHARAWVPSLAIAAASFLVGMVWLTQQPRPEEQEIAKRESTVADREMPRPMGIPKGVAPSPATTNDLSGTFDAPAPAAGDTTAEFRGGGISSGIGGAGGGAGFGGAGFGGGMERDLPPPQRARTEPAAPKGVADRNETLVDLAQRKDAAAAVPDSAIKSAMKSTPNDGADPGKKLFVGESPKGEAVKESLHLKDSLDRKKELSPLPKSASNPLPPARAARTAEKDSDQDPVAGRDKTAEQDEKSELHAEAGQKAEGLGTQPRGRLSAGSGANDVRLSKALGDGETRSSGSIWVPLLVADENGEAVIEFTMPKEPGNYKLVLEVLGPGRATQLEKLIRCEVPPPAGPAGPTAKP